MAGNNQSLLVASKAPEGACSGELLNSQFEREKASASSIGALLLGKRVVVYQGAVNGGDSVNVSFGHSKKSCALAPKVNPNLKQVIPSKPFGTSMERRQVYKKKGAVLLDLSLESHPQSAEIKPPKEVQT
ncbi:hypothetical protein Patl1_23773 [Pistacia atlantica]|uniref:Uncharacterized protein n=1 Tax=Pistacia atlantica TaxID=434234 RepID=A0ACC1A3M6_9ROSI|nr:hypothetical protein Patl1_23773 [Pistacia atlantica]